MGFIFRNLIRASIVMMLVLSYYYVNPQTAEWHDLLRVALQGVHNSNVRTIFATLWIMACGLDMALSGTTTISLPAMTVSRSHSVSYVDRPDD